MMKKIQRSLQHRRSVMGTSGKKNSMGLVICLILLCSFLLCGYGSYTQGAQRVFDDADLLTEIEEQTVQAEIEKTIDKLSMDIIVVTTDDSRGKSAMAYADDFYDQNGFGYGDSYGPGVLFLIDVDNREIYISTAGEGIAAFSDWEIEQMLDQIFYWVSEGQWYDACMEFVYQVDEYGDNEETAQNGYYDKNTDTFVEYTEAELKAMRRKAAIDQVLSAGSIVSKLFIAVIIGAVSVLIMCISVNKNSAPSGQVYMKPGSEQIRQRYDHKTNTTVTKRHIPRNNNTSGMSRSGGGGGGGHSSVHRSSGGRSHGGGGRRF